MGVEVTSALLHTSTASGFLVLKPGDGERSLDQARGVARRDSGGNFGTHERHRSDGLHDEHPRARGRRCFPLLAEGPLPKKALTLS